MSTPPHLSPASSSSSLAAAPAPAPNQGGGRLQRLASGIASLFSCCAPHRPLAPRALEPLHVIQLNSPLRSGQALQVAAAAPLPPAAALVEAVHPAAAAALPDQQELLEENAPPVVQVAAAVDKIFCSICRDNANSNEFIHLPSCNHRFQKVCLKAWMENGQAPSRTCPECRTPISASVYQEFDLERPPTPAEAAEPAVASFEDRGANLSTMSLERSREFGRLDPHAFDDDDDDASAV